MTALLDPPAARRTHRPSPAERLRTMMAAARVSFTWFGSRKTLTAEQKAEAADTFGAEGQFLSAGKKLIDTRHEKFKAVSSVRSQIIAYWRSLSLPYPEPGIRLIRRDRIDAFNDRLSHFSEELWTAVGELDAHYEQLKATARLRLSRLFNPSDYPASLTGLFAVTWDYPSVEPPDYLQQLNPELYRQECQRVTARFDEAVQLAEQAFFDELSKLVSHLTERLSGTDDGKPKVFRDSAIENLTEFFERFRRLNVNSSAQLDELVERAQQVMRGRGPQDCNNSALRQQITMQLSQVQASLDGLMVDRPRRRIVRAHARRGDHLMDLIVDPAGQVRCVYGEAIDLRALGSLSIRRASHVEPDDQGRWLADLAPVGGPKLGPFDLRADALTAETVWLAEHWLTFSLNDSCRPIS